MNVVSCADNKKFAVYHTVYRDSDIFTRFDWNESVTDTIDCISDKNRCFIFDDDKLIGGFALKDNVLNYPFTVPPFGDKNAFWRIALKYAVQTSRQNEIFLCEIPETDVKILIQSLGAALKSSKRRMLRPTAQYSPVLCDGFSFDSLAEKDMEESINVVFEAHSAGYTSTVWEPDRAEIKEAVERRFRLFGQTDTLHMSNVVRDEGSREIAGVCIAGIYPDSANNFSTIHQVSVRPKYRRMGIAKAMILKSITEASSVSPVITLGVLCGNPAETLYREVGFVAGPSYSELIYAI